LRKWFVVVVFVSLAGAGFSQGTDYSDPEGAYPVQLALFPPVQLVSSQEDVTGFRLNLIGVNREVSALDIGLVNWTTGEFRGVGAGLVNVVCTNAYGAHVGFFNSVSGDMTGFQGIPLLTFWNAANIVQGRASGIQGGLYNQSADLNGAQVGLVNAGYDASGVQLGLYNFSFHAAGLQAGLINIGYESAHGLQLGLLNQTGQFTGLQIGLVNRTDSLRGMQIGLLNIVSEKDVWPVTPLVNWVF
jgi:hypothetical protein